MIGTSEASSAANLAQSTVSTREITTPQLKRSESSTDGDDVIKMLERNMPKALDYLEERLSEKDPNISESVLSVIDRLREYIGDKGISEDSLELYDNFDEKLTSYNISLDGLSDSILREKRKALSETNSDERAYFNKIIEKASLKTKMVKLSWIYGLASTILSSSLSGAPLASDNRERCRQLLRVKSGSPDYEAANEELEESVLHMKSYLTQSCDASGKPYLTVEEANQLPTRETAERLVKFYTAVIEHQPRDAIAQETQFFMVGFIDYISKYTKENLEALQPKLAQYPDLFNKEDISNIEGMLKSSKDFLSRPEIALGTGLGALSRTIKSPFLDQIKESFFDRFVPLWRFAESLEVRADEGELYMSSLQKRITSVAEYFRDHRKELLTLHDSDPKQLHDFIYSEGNYAEDVNKKYGATGLLETIRDQEEGTTYAAEAKVLKNQSQMATFEAAFNQFCDNEPEEQRRQPKSRAQQKKKNSSSKRKSQKIPAEISQDADPDNAYDTLIHYAPRSIEQLVAEFQHPHSILEGGQGDYDTVRKNNKQRFHGKAYYKVKSFLTNPNGRTAISAGGKAVTNTQQFRTIKFFPTKQAKGDGTDPSPTLTHIQERHPDVFEFAAGGSPMEKVKNLLRQVVDKVSEENIEISDHFITPDRQKKTLKAIKFTANVKFNGVTRKATCVFSKPPWDAQMSGLVMRTAYLHEEEK